MSSGMRNVTGGMAAAAVLAAVLLWPGSMRAQTQDQKNLPVYIVKQSGASPEQAAKLADALGLPAQAKGAVAAARGEISFLDADRFQAVPTKRVGAGKAGEDRGETVEEALDFAALANRKSIADERVRSRFETALRQSGLLPQQSETRISHSTFRAVDLAGKTVAEARLDTRVYLAQSLDGVPLIGPGAKISATFDAEARPVRLHYASRTLERGESVPVLPQAEAEKRCAAAFGGGAARAEARLVYYAPPLDLPAVKTILPHYDCGGVVRRGDREVIPLRRLIPAVTGSKLVPEAYLEAKAEGSSVSAAVRVKGGTPPYRFDWGARGNGKTSSDRVRYRVGQREKLATDTVTVTVLDANGISVVASQVVAVSPVVAVAALIQDSAARLFGSENAVTNQFGALEQGFVDRMVADSVGKQFQWTGIWAWEKDFKPPLDASYVDNADITFYVGHGSPGGFTFEDSTHDDSTLDTDDTTAEWGDKDLEWLALMSCQVLAEESGGQDRAARWGQEFDRLHLLLGFHTNAYAWSSFSGEFADNMLRASPLRVRQAWFAAVDSDQPDEVVAVVMGAYRRTDFVSDYNDFFWGEGAVGPDIGAGAIAGFWWVTGP